MLRLDYEMPPPILTSQSLLGGSALRAYAVFRTFGGHSSVPVLTFPTFW